MKLYIKELYKERFIVEEIQIDKYKYFVVKDTKFNKYYSGNKFTSKIEDRYYFMFYENALTKSKILSNTEI